MTSHPGRLSTLTSVPYTSSGNQGVVSPGGDQSVGVGGTLCAVNMCKCDVCVCDVWCVRCGVRIHILVVPLDRHLATAPPNGCIVLWDLGKSAKNKQGSSNSTQLTHLLQSVVDLLESGHIGSTNYIFASQNSYLRRTTNEL